MPSYPTSVVPHSNFLIAIRPILESVDRGDGLMISHSDFCSVCGLLLFTITDDILIGRTELEPLHDRWIDVDFQIKVGNGSAGSLRWILKNGSTTVIDKSRTGIDTFLADRVRPKWGIYRSLGDTSGSLQNCYLLLSNMRGYQLI